MKNAIVFLRKILIFLALFCLLDYLSGIGLKQLFYKQKSGKYYTTLYGLEKAKESIMIFGNSHANEHFDALLMEKKLNMPAFNFGNKAQSILYYYPLLKTVLQRHTPRLVIIQIEYFGLNYMEEDYEALSVFLPFRGYNQYVDSAIGTIGKYEMYKTYSSLYKYNSTLGYTLLNTFKSTYNKSNESRGFDPINGSLCDYVSKVKNKPVLNNIGQSHLKFDSLKLKYLTNIIDELEAKKIKSVFVITPLYWPQAVNDNPYFIELKKNLSARGLPLWNYAQDTSYLKKCELFNDPGHLNATGARIFTENIIERIRPLLN